MGADHVVDFTREDPVSAIQRITKGRGVDVAIEALGKQQTFEWALRAIRPELARIGGVKLSVRDSDWGGNQKLLQLDVRGMDVTVINRVAEQIAA